MKTKQEMDVLCEKVIGACIEVHRHLGPGLLERVYHVALAIEFGLRSIAFISEYDVNGMFKGHNLGLAYRADFLVEGDLIVEIKSVDEMTPRHLSTAIGYVSLSEKPSGLLINFNVLRLTDGIRRIFPVIKKITTSTLRGDY